MILQVNGLRTTQADVKSILSCLRETSRLHVQLGDQQAREILGAAAIIAQALKRGQTIIWFGNGGSAADAQHIAAEFVNKLNNERSALAALALTTDSSVLTSIANDRAYDQVFARQLEALGRSGDVALGITTSGHSPNVLEGLREAEERGLVTVGLLGRDGGKALKLCRYPIVVPHSDTQRIQEVHIMTGHLLVDIIERVLLGTEATS